MKRSALLASLLVLAGVPATATETAGELLRQRRYVEAAQAFEERVRARPDDADAHHQLGRLALKRRDYAAAVPLLEKAVHLRPGDAAYQFHYGAACVQHADTLGKTLRALGLARRGRTAMERAVALAPAEVEFHDGLIEFYARAPGIVGGGLEKARAQAEVLRRLEPRAGMLALAMVHLRAKETAAAFALYEAWLAQAPDDYQVLYLAGRAAADHGHDPEGGLRHLRRCLDLPPPPRGVSHAVVQFHLGRLLERQGDLEAARSSYRAALALDPAHAPAADALTALD